MIAREWQCTIETNLSSQLIDVVARNLFLMCCMAVSESRRERRLLSKVGLLRPCNCLASCSLPRVSAKYRLNVISSSTQWKVRPSRHGETARRHCLLTSETVWSAAVVVATELKPNSITLAGSELVRSWFKAGSKPNCITLSGSNQLRTSFEPAPNQLRTSFEPDSVMEFGRKPASSC